MEKFKTIEEAETAMKAGIKHNVKDRWAEKYNAYKAATIPSLRERESLTALFVDHNGSRSVSFHNTREAARNRRDTYREKNDLYNSVKTVITPANSDTANRLLSGMKVRLEAKPLERTPRVKTAKPLQHSMF